MPRKIRHRKGKFTVYHYKKHLQARRARLEHRSGPPAPASHKEVVGKEYLRAIAEYRWLSDNCCQYMTGRPKAIAQALRIQAENSRSAFNGLRQAFNE
jgi:hypothetical protein